MVKISVLLATYIGEKYIGEQLRSLFKQTLVPDEILIGDDSPDEATKKAIDSVLFEYPDKCNVIYKKNQVRLGIVANFEFLLQQASGDFIFFCDQDDVWLPEKIQILAGALEANPNKMLAFCDSLRTDNLLNPIGDPLYSGNDKENIACSDALDEPFYSLMNYHFFVYAHNIVIRRDFRDILLPFPTHYDSHDTWMGFIAAYLEKIIYVNKILTYYRLHSDNFSHQNLHETSLCCCKKRICQIFTQSEISELHTNLERFRTFRTEAAQHIPEEMRIKSKTDLLDDLIRYYEARIDLLNQSRWRRMFVSAQLWKWHRKYASGWRSVLRDAISTT